MNRMKLMPFIGLGLTLFLSKPHLLYGNTNFGGGGGTESDPYLLSTPEHLTELQVAVDGGNTFSGKYFVLTNDIDLEEYDNDSNPNNGNFEPIGYWNSRDDNKCFSGVLDGKGYKILNLKILLPNKDDVGLFASTSTGFEVSDLILDNVHIEGGDCVGALSGVVSDSKVDNVVVSGQVKGVNDVGGIAGAMYDTIANHLSMSGIVLGEGWVGGLMGEFDSSEISHATFDGEVAGSTMVGGLAGYFWCAEAYDSYSSGKVSGTEDVGGFSGALHYSMMNNCYSLSSVAGGDSVGGLVGWHTDSTILDAYHVGGVVGGQYVGGIVGNDCDNSLIGNVYHIGEISGTTNVGRVVGWHEDTSTIKNVYYNSEENMDLPVIGLDESTVELGEVIGLKAYQMNQKNSSKYMTLFDFENIWTSTSTTPMLQWQKDLIYPNQDDIQINGNVETMIADVTIPSVSPDLVINPNLPEGVVSPEFSVSNDSVSPIKLDLKTFEQTTNTFNDVLPDKYDSWVGLNKAQSRDIALGLIAKEGEGWQTLTTPTSYVAGHSEHEIGIIKPTSSVDFSFDVKHGRAFSEAKTVQYKMVFVFDLLS